MDTRKIASLCNLPDCNEGTFVEIDRMDERIHSPIEPQCDYTAQ